MMPMRKSHMFLTFLFLALLLFGLMFFHAAAGQQAAAAALEEKRSLVKKLELTDLCLFTEARYTRHPAVADLNTPFQDYPMSIEHYPSGTLLLPPAHWPEGR